MITPVFPEASFQSQIESGIAQGSSSWTSVARPSQDTARASSARRPYEARSGLAANIALADAGGKTDIAVAFDPNIAALQAEADGVKAEVAKNGDGSQVLDIEQKRKCNAGG